jgi:hypothetical protein
LVEQWTAGTHTALEIVMASCGAGLRCLVAGFVELPPVDLLDGVGEPEGAPVPDGVPPPAGAAAPPEPGDVADPSGGWASVEQARQNASSTVLRTIEVDRL